MNTSKAFKELTRENNERIIHGVLKRLGISRRQSNYEDLVSEGRLLFVEAYKNYRKSHQNYIKDEFKLFAYQKIRWGIIDILRKEKRLAEKNCSFEVKTKQGFDILDQNDIENLILESELIKKLWKICSKRERDYLSLASKGYKMSEISRKLKVSRTSVSKWRKSVLNKYKSVVEI